MRWEWHSCRSCTHSVHTAYTQRTDYSLSLFSVLLWWWWCRVTKLQSHLVPLTEINHFWDCFPSIIRRVWWIFYVQDCGGWRMFVTTEWCNCEDCRGIFRWVMAEETDFWGVSVSYGCQGFFVIIASEMLMLQLNWYRQMWGCLCSVVASMLFHMMWGCDFIFF